MFVYRLHNDIVFLRVVYYWYILEISDKNKGGVLLKKQYLLILCLIISLLFGTYTFLIQKRQKQTANETLIQCLNQAENCFGVDYTKLDGEGKIFYYMKASSNLYAAINILPYTSYSNVKNNNPELANALSGLYLSMTVQSTPKANNRWIAVTEKRQAIFNCLHYISINPNDKNNCKALIKIANSIKY